MRPLVSQCAAHTVRLWAFVTVRRPLVLRRGCVRRFQTSRLAPISVADRIKQFLPKEAMEAEEDASAQPFETSSAYKGPGLSAYSAEIKEIDILVTQGELALACRRLLEKLPLHVVLSALVDRIIPLVSKSPISDLGIYEIAYHLHLLDQSAVASQLLQSASSEEVNTTMHICEFDIVQNLREGSCTAGEVDFIIQEHTSTHFPQILQSHHSRWFKARLLAALDDKNFEITFKRFSDAVVPAVGPPGVALLVTTNRSIAVYNMLKAYVFQKWDAHYVNALVRATTTSDAFSRSWWQLRKRLNDHAHMSTDPVLMLAIPSLLRVSLKLKETYESASICRYGAAQLEQHPSLVAKALLAAAFAQKRPETQESVVSSPKQDLQTFLVSRTLTPVAADPVKCDHVIAMAASWARSAGGLPSRVFWQLVLSLPPHMTLGPRSSRALASVVSSRPYLEQLRFMALPIVTSRGVCELLRLNIDRIVAHRRVNRIADTVQQSEEDINLLMAGMVLASEKVSGTDAASQERELAKIVDTIFESWKGQEAVGAVASTAHSNNAVASVVVQQIVHALVHQKSYTIALQVLRLVQGPHRSATLEMLLLGIARDTPARTHLTVSWLLRTAKIRVPPYILNKVIVEICKSSKLTETQLKNQCQDIRRLMRAELNAVVSSAAAKALVEALLNSAISQGKGSRVRLRWALSVAKMARVSKRDFSRWTHKLEEMQEKRQGYWAQ